MVPFIVFSATAIVLYAKQLCVTCWVHMKLLISDTEKKKEFYSPQVKLVNCKKKY